MKKHIGGITSYLNKTTTKVAESPNMNNQLKDIDIHLLETNNLNFYGLREIEALAGMISTAGYIDPLEVKLLESGKYQIISGHRRHAAITLLIQNGERIDPKIPCIVRTFEPKGPLSAEEIERCYLIFSNRGQRQYRTVSEKLEEIRLLEPIARKIWETERQNGVVEGNFRAYFAEELSMSSSSLQRLLSLKKLIPEAMEAVNTGSISETAAAKLAILSENEQKMYLEKFKTGEADGTTRELSQLLEKPEERNDPESSSMLVGSKEAGSEEMMPASSEKKNDSFSEGEDAGSGNIEEILEHNGQEKLFSQNGEVDDALPVTKADDKIFDEAENPCLDTEDQKLGEQENTSLENEPLLKVSDITLQCKKAEQEADLWVLQGLKDMLRTAIRMTATEKANGNEVAAAQWDVRRSQTALLMTLLSEES